MSKYQLVKPEPPKEKQFKVTIVADSNDADYITTISTYEQDDFDEYVADDLINLLNHYSGRYKLEDFDGEIDIPHSDCGVCHSLESVEVTCIDEYGDLYNVVLNR